MCAALTLRWRGRKKIKLQLTRVPELPKENIPERSLFGLMI